MWHEAEYSVTPSEVDKSSSSEFVYLRKDIKEVKRDEEVVYTCLERTIPKSEYETYREQMAYNDYFMMMLEE